MRRIVATKAGIFVLGELKKGEGYQKWVEMLSSCKRRVVHDAHFAERPFVARISREGNVYQVMRLMAHGRTKNVTHPSGSAFWNILVLIMTEKKITNSKPIPHIPLPFKEAIADVLKVKPPEKTKAKRARPKET